MVFHIVGDHAFFFCCHDHIFVYCDGIGRGKVDFQEELETGQIVNSLHRLIVKMLTDAVHRPKPQIPVCIFHDFAEIPVAYRIRFILIVY